MSAPPGGWSMPKPTLQRVLGSVDELDNAGIDPGVVMERGVSAVPWYGGRCGGGGGAPTGTYQQGRHRPSAVCTDHLGIQLTLLEAIGWYRGL